jgi:hypothetical protein
LGGKNALTAAGAEMGRRNESTWSLRKPLAAARLDLGRPRPINSSHAATLFVVKSTISKFLPGNRLKLSGIFIIVVLLL